MIYSIIYNLLRNSPEVVNRVGTNIFAEHVPAGVKGECIVIRNLSGSAESHLGGETDCAMPVIQLDCYAKSQLRAESLYQRVRNRLSGFRGTVDVMDDVGDEQSIEVGEITLLRPGMFVDEPRDGSDEWSYRYSADFNVFHAQSVPTLT